MVLDSSVPPPRSNRLSDAPGALDENLQPRDSFVAIQRMVAPEELSVVFQPIVDLRSGRLFAYEALVRCQVDELRSPPILFDRALELGCVGRLGRMIREAAIPLCSGVPLFLNVHPQELNESWLIRPDDPIFLHDSDVYLEITESVPLTHFQRCLTLLHEIRGRGGIHLVVDDLGAGFSNLKTISDLEPRVVKLDRDLVAGIHRSPRQRQLVNSVVRLCRDLDALTVVEGVETVEEFEVIRDSGADYGQGYLFARPSYPAPPVTWPARIEAEVPTAKHLLGDAKTLVGQVAPKRK